METVFLMKPSYSQMLFHPFECGCTGKWSRHYSQRPKSPHPCSSENIKQCAGACSDPFRQHVWDLIHTWTEPLLVQVPNSISANHLLLPSVLDWRPRQSPPKRIKNIYCRLWDVLVNSHLISPNATVILIRHVCFMMYFSLDEPLMNNDKLMGTNKDNNRI